MHAYAVLYYYAQSDRCITVDVFMYYSEMRIIDVIKITYVTLKTWTYYCDSEEQGAQIYVHICVFFAHALIRLNCAVIHQFYSIERKLSMASKPQRMMYRKGKNIDYIVYKILFIIIRDYTTPILLVYHSIYFRHQFRPVEARIPPSVHTRATCRACISYEP